MRLQLNSRDNRSLGLQSNLLLFLKRRLSFTEGFSTAITKLLVIQYLPDIKCEVKEVISRGAVGKRN